MRIKVGFFRSNVSDYFIKIKNGTSILIYSFCLTTFLVVLSSRLEIKENIFNFATNIVNTNSDNLLVDNFKKIYPVFNEENYIVEENNDVQMIMEEDIQEEEEIINYLNDFARIDDIEKVDVQSVFSLNKPLNISITDGSSYQKVDINGILLYNYSSKRDFDFNNLYERVINLTKKNDKILLYNTHTSESYKNSENYKFEYSGTYRSKDARYNMLSVSKSLETNLREKDFNVIVNTTPHDYASYTSSYINSRKTYLAEIEEYKSFGMAIDLHRDACADLSFAPKVDINGTTVAQCMFVLGIGPEGNRGPYYEDNVALVLKLQTLAEEIYPGLFRKTLIRDSTYNQDLGKNSILIEVGATGNTLEEAYLATRCLSNLFDLIYID